MLEDMVAPSPDAPPDTAPPDDDATPPRKSYPGSKGQAGTWRRICALMPRHRVYVEPFLGSGVILRNKRAAEWELGIEADEGAAAAFRGRPAGQPQPLVIVGDAMQFFKQLTTPYVAWVEDPHDVLVYVDAPYPLDVRAGRRMYKRELTDGDLAADKAAHKHLLNTLIALPCRVMVSCYWNPLYVTMLQEWQGWRAESFKSQTRGGVSQEWVWCNFGPDVPLHDTTHVGRGFRERERIKRKRTRWVTMFSKMPPAERQVIADALAEVEGKLRTSQ
jgi:DNA adenine methylase